MAVMSQKTGKKFVNYSFNTITYIVVIIAIFPIYWMISTSLKTSWEAQQLPPAWIFKPTLENYISLFTGGGSSGSFTRLLLNSIIVSITATVLSAVFGAFAAYSLSRFRMKKSKDIAMFILSTRMFPPAATLIPVFMMMNWFHLIDRYAVLIIPYTAFNLSFSVWMLKGFFDEIPQSLEEAAIVDGCSRFTAFLRIIVPLVTPGLAATAIICLMFSWNEFMYALVLTRNKVVTAPVIANQFVTMYGVRWGELTAAATIMTLPVFVFAILVRNYIIKGLTFGSVKG